MTHNENKQHEPAEGTMPRAGSGNYSGRRKLGGSMITMPTDSDVMTLQEAAELLKCNPATIKRRAKSLGIPQKRLRSLWRLSRKALQAWMEEEDKAA